MAKRGMLKPRYFCFPNNNTDTQGGNLLLKSSIPTTESSF